VNLIFLFVPATIFHHNEEPAVLIDDPLGLNRNYSPHLVALKQQRGVTKRLFDAVVSTLVLLSSWWPQKKAELNKENCVKWLADIGAWVHPTSHSYYV